MNYYNEIDPKAAAWLQELIHENIIPNGKIDTRSIEQVEKRDLDGFTQCHFFAGIGGWSEALRLAGWPENKPVWTGSCPCQSFSEAGEGKGFDDPRGQLWFEFFRLIQECRPEHIFGEQVAASIRHGWLDRVSADLEAEDYAVGAAVLGAHSVGAPHIRKRLYWVADPNGRQSSDGDIQRGRKHRQQSEDGGGSRLADAELARRQASRSTSKVDTRREPEQGFTSGGMANPSSARQQSPGSRPETKTRYEAWLCRPECRCADGGMANPNHQGPQRRRQSELPECPEQKSIGPRSPQDFWSEAIWHQCRDGKARRTSPEPSLFPLAHGIPGRVGLLRGAGNAILPQVGAAFIQAFNEITA